MNIVIAPDSYKETLSALEVAQSIQNGFQRVFSNCTYDKVPLADGGEGTVEAMISATNGKLIKTKVLDPLQREVEAFYGLLGDNKTAVIEMASSSGLELLTQEEKNPMNTTTYGFGQLINHALQNGVKNFILGLGGSATNDCGIGMLQALGVKFYDANQKELDIVCGKDILSIKNFDDSLLKSKFKDVDIQVACDVSNPLCGENGSSYVFAKQKGASETMIEELDKSLFEFSLLCEDKYGINTRNIEGCGAAGGLGYALITFLRAKLLSGIDIVMSTVNLEQKIQDCSLVITGEGKIDSQSVNGKTPVGVASLAKKHDKKVIAIAGCLGDGYELVYDYGIDAIFDTTVMSKDFDSIKKDAKKNLENVAYNIAVSLKMSI